MGNMESQIRKQLGDPLAADNKDALWSLQSHVRNADYQEIAAVLLHYHKATLEKTALSNLERIVEEKPKFGYWAINNGEYDQDYSLAMDLGQLQVFKGNVASDRDQYRLAKRLNRDHPNLVGLSLFDYRRQFTVFLSSKAGALRRFALVEMARHENPEQTILF